MYITESYTSCVASEYTLFSCSFTLRKEISVKRNARTYRSTHSRISTRKSFHACPRVLTRVSETEGTRARLRERGLTREHAAAWNTRCLLPGPLDQHTLSRSAKSPFSPPVRRDERTRAHAPSTKTTHRRRSSRARQSLLHALKS